LKNRNLLTFTQRCQEHNLAVRKFQRIVMRRDLFSIDLSKDRWRPAKIGDVLTTRDFGTGTRGFAASEDLSVAVCVLPGTELAFAHAKDMLTSGKL